MDEKLLGKLCFLFSAMLGYLELHDETYCKVFKTFLSSKELAQIHEHKTYDFDW